jgi:predicted dehydrogenase
MELRRAGELLETVTVDNGDGYTRMLDSFALAFRGKGTFAASGEDGVINMRAVDCAYKSWRSGRREAV